MQTLVKAADEELLGSWASVTAKLISFLRSHGLPIYDKLANALDAMADEDEDPSSPTILAVSIIGTTGSQRQSSVLPLGHHPN